MRLKSIISIAAVIALSAFDIRLSTTFAQGQLMPPGAPAPVMKSLDQIEPRTPISSAPFTIAKSGSYYLTANLNVSGGSGSTNGINLNASQVTLDLNGFTISSSAPSATGYAILLGANLKNITIMNGYIQGSVTETGGVFSGGGFESGIFVVLDANNTNTSGLPVNMRVSGLSVSGCLNFGIVLGPLSTLVDSCNVQTTGNYGIYAETIKSSSARDCGGVAIYGTQVSDCHAESIGSNWGLYAGYTAQNCYGSSTGSDGIHAQQMARDCYGVSTAAGFYGIYTDQAINCYGVNYNGIGLRATSSALNCHGMGGTLGLGADETAENCYGRCNTNGVGLSAFNANNCYGYCPGGNSGFGLSATEANNCFGQHAENGIGLSATIAIGCHGRCYGNNYGISANILNSCFYYRQVGTPGYSGTKYNMP